MNTVVKSFARITFRIGAGSVVSANNVVSKDIPANCIAVGNPAVVVR
ncbi:MAG: hypothetical protein KF746_17625 [Chitinophagaceae bacterium]|nr:hypothetical protein [Chitinophagaceae bacterium]